MPAAIHRALHVHQRWRANLEVAGVDADPQPSAFQPRQELLPDPIGILVAVADKDVVPVVRLGAIGASFLREY